MGNILTAHALSGCDTTSALCGIGKLTALKVLRSGKTVESLGNVQVHERDILLQCTAFIAACYGHIDETDMTAVRFKVWTKKIASHKLNSALKLEVLPLHVSHFISMYEGLTYKLLFGKMHLLQILLT